MSLDGSLALVTGGSRGIGLAVARGLLTRGAHVALLARDEARLDAAARTLRDAHPGATVLALPADVGDEAQVRRAFEAIEAAGHGVDVLVNNAGIVHRAALVDTDPAAFDAVLRVNLRGAYLCARAALPGMIARRRGRIVNVSSISGTMGTPMLSAYCASKWGLLGLTRALAEEVREHEILVAAVCPGSVDTEMLRQGVPGLEPDMRPEEAAVPILFLCDEAPLAMTGAAVEIFG